MKKVLKMIGLFSLIGFSFFYTDKVVDVIREEDEVMIKIKEVSDIYKVDAIDAKIKENTIIPGLNGRKINIDASYKAMMEQGVFNKNKLIYDTISPDITVRLNKDKFIIMGNNNKQMVSLVFILDSNKNIDEFEKIIRNKGISVNYFVDYNYLINNSPKIKEMSDNNEFYSYGNSGEYAPDNLLFSNNLISRITKNTANYCLATDMNKKTLELCTKNDLYTITPSIICEENAFKTVKENLNSGSIILLKMNNDTLTELGTIIDYIEGKGLKIGVLSKTLSEEIE